MSDCPRERVQPCPENGPSLAGDCGNGLDAASTATVPACRALSTLDSTPLLNPSISEAPELYSVLDVSPMASMIILGKFLNQSRTDCQMALAPSQNPLMNALPFSTSALAISPMASVARVGKVLTSATMAPMRSLIAANMASQCRRAISGSDANASMPARILASASAKAALISSQ